MRICRAVLCGCLSLLAAGAMAGEGPGELDRHIAAIERRYESMQDMQAGFTQESRSGALPVVQHGAGTVRLKKGGKMLWDYTSPERQQIILDGTNLWLYLPDDKQVMKNDYARLPSHIVADLFRGRVRLRERFAVRREQEPCAPGRLCLALIPREETPSVKSLRMTIDTATYDITATEIEDMFGNRTLLRFSGIVTDAGIDDAVFVFTPPPGVDVFELPSENP
jgi:outer membrane lipoprotein carrier protein